MGYAIPNCQVQHDAANKPTAADKRTSKIEASYKLERTVLENVDSVKFLGVTINLDLKWNTPTSNVCTKGNRTLVFCQTKSVYEQKSPTMYLKKVFNFG